VRRFTLPLATLVLSLAASQSPAAENTRGIGAGLAAGRAALRAARIEAEKFLPLRQTPLPRWLRRMGHPLRAQAGVTLRIGEEPGSRPTLTWNNDVFSVARGPVRLFRHGGYHAGHLFHSFNDWPGGAEGAVKLTSFWGNQGGKTYIKFEQQDETGDRRVERVVAAYQAQADINLPGGRMVEKGSWAVVDRADGARPARYSLWRWQASPGSRRVKEPLSEAEFSAVSGEPAAPAAK